VLPLEVLPVIPGAAAPLDGEPVPVVAPEPGMLLEPLPPVCIAPLASRAPLGEAAGLETCARASRLQASKSARVGLAAWAAPDIAKSAAPATSALVYLLRFMR
jgi:hypothetical protein